MPSKSVVGTLALVALAVGSLVEASAAPAANGVYTVFSCKGPGGVVNAADGWKPASAGGATTSNDCLQGGALVAQLAGPNPAAASGASWSFTAPANTSIVSFTAQRRTTGVTHGQYGQDKGAPSYHLYLDNTVLDSCEESNTSECQGDLTAPLDKEGLSGSTLTFAVQCGSSGVGPSCQNAIGVIYSQVAMGFRDDSAPTVSDVQVLDDGVRSGTMKVGYSANDLGGGLYNTVLKVDGEPASNTPIAPGTSCAPAGGSGGDAFAFTEAVPCPLSASGLQASVDVKSLPAGPHGVELDVQDAAGNMTPVHGPVTFPTPNTGVSAQSTANPVAAVKAAMGGTLRMWFVTRRGHRRTVRTKLGTREVTRGFLRDANGHGIVGARVTVYHLVGPNGKRKILKTGLKSRAGGALTMILPKDLDTRRIQFRYQALVPGPITSKQTLSLRVYRHGRLFKRT